MSEATGIFESQLASLLRLIATQREERCAAIRERMQMQRRQILRQAFGEARGRMHEAIGEERRRRRQQLAAAEAARQSRLRQRRQQLAVSMLAAGRDALGAALLARWRDAEGRTRWTVALIDQALRLLPAVLWEISHPSAWDPGELGELRGRISEYCKGEPAFHPADDIQAGLRIFAEGAVLDGTIEGLLADRADIEGQLLSEIDRLLAERTPPGGQDAKEQGSDRSSA